MPWTKGLPLWLSGKESDSQMQEMWIWSLGREYPLKKEMATNSSILALDIPWTEDPSGLQSRNHKRVRQNLVTKQPWTEPGTKDTKKKNELQFMISEMSLVKDMYVKEITIRR